MARICKTLATYREIVQGRGISEIEETASREKLLGIVQLFEGIGDTRCSGMICYPLSEILVICFLAVLANADTWVEIENFGKAKEGWLKTFLPLRHGVASHDTFQRVLGMVDRQELQKVTVEYLESVMDRIADTLAASKADEEAEGEDEEEKKEYRHLSMDGKEERGSGRKEDTDEEIPNIQTLHIYDCSNGICLQSEPIDSKTNEIPVGQSLLKLMNLKECVVTADAIHTQKLTCKTIMQQGGNYVLGLKGNHSSLLEEAALCFTDEELKKARKSKDKKAPFYVEESDKAHNQVEKRRYYMVKAYHEPRDKDDLWKGLQSYIRVEKDTENLVTGKKRTEIRYYISSLCDLPLCAGLIRGHWGVENGLHWQLDYTFRSDENSTMDRTALTNLGLMKKMALTLLKLFQPLLTGHRSLRVLRKMTAWEPETFIPLIFHSFSKESIRHALMFAGHSKSKS